MPVGSIHTAKEQALTYQPLLLATITFADGAVLRLATHGLRTADGGFQYGGHDYLPRILNQDIAAVQALSEGGVDLAPQVTLALNDADQWLYTNYEQPRGFKGAKLALTFVFWNVGENDFSSDSVTKFLGVCSAPQIEETQLVLTATSLMNMQQVTLPPVRIQKRCPWVFPKTKAQRVAGAVDADSWFYECGYSPDVSDTDAPGGTAAARGNMNGGVPFTDCNYSTEQCQARGMYRQDSLVRITGRFGGVQWDPPQSWRGRAFSSGKFEEGLNSPNEPKYNDPVPMVYGEGWVEPVIANIVGDPNSTRFEAILCYGPVDGVNRVIVNDVEVPFQGRDPLFSWYWVTQGNRSGAPNMLPGWTDAAGQPTSDPYGSMATIAIVVYRQLVNSNQTPRVRVLLRGPKLRVYDTDTTHSLQGWPGYTNPAWQLMDLLVWGGWDYADLDIASFRAAAAVCDATISYKDQHGNTNSHQRFASSLVLRQRRSAAEIIRAMRNNGRFLLVPNSDAGGKLRLLVKQTLAAQQPAPVAGSNFNTAVPSKLASGSAANGYAAYRFSEANIVRRQGQSTLRVLQRANSESPNRISVTYQDAQNGHAQDSLTVVEAEALVRNSSQEVAGNFPLEGVTRFDQARRLIGTHFAETLRGNPRNFPAGDPGGTLVFEWETTFRAVHLWVGALVLLDYPALDLANQLVRIQRIQPATNFETVKITASWHSDEWYLDSWGQEDPPRYSGQGLGGEARPPWPLLGQAGNRSLTKPDPLTGWERLFGLDYLSVGDSFRLKASVTLPTNQFTPEITAPFVPTQGTTAPTGGAIPGGASYWVWLVAHNAQGRVSRPSRPCQIQVPAGTNTNTVTVPGVQWQPGTVNYSVYIGTDPFRPLYQSTSVGTPASVTVTTASANLASRPMPDPEFDAVEVRLKRVLRAGVRTVAPTAATATTITVAGAGWTTNEWAGYDVTLMGHDTGNTDDPRAWSWRVASNTADTLTLDTNFGPDANTVLTFGPFAGYRLAIRTKPTAWTASTVTEPKWNLTVNEGQGKLLRAIAGAGRGQTYTIASNTATQVTIQGEWVVTPDATTRFVIEDAEWAVVHRSDSLQVSAHPFTGQWFDVDISGLERQDLLCMVAPVDGGGQVCPDQFNQVWDFYLFYGGEFAEGELPTIGPVTGTVLTTPPPAGWASNPDYYTETWFPYPTAGVHITYTPPADAEFTGVDVWSKVGSEAPVNRGRFHYSGSGPGTLEVWFERPDQDVGAMEFTLATRSRYTTNPPDFANAGATITVAIQGKNTLTAAITGATMSIQYAYIEKGETWGITMSAPLPVTNQTWAFLELWIIGPGAGATPRLVAVWGRNDPSPATLVTRDWGVPSDDETTPNKLHRFELRLIRLDGTSAQQANPWGNGTPYRDFTVTRQVGTVGVENGPAITINGPATVLEYSTNQDGVSVFRAKSEWTLPPAKVRYGGVELYLAPSASVSNRFTWIHLGTAPATATSITTPWMPTPAPGDWVLLFLTIDPWIRENTYAAGVTPQKAFAIPATSGALQLSRTIGKLVHQGVTSPFEGVEVRAQNTQFTTAPVAWMGSALEDASVLDLAVTAGNITCRVANIAPYLTLVGQFLRITHATNSALWERFKILSINSSTRVITLEYTATGAVAFQNSYPINSPVRIDYVGGWFEQLRVGKTLQDAPFYVDNDGNVQLRTAGDKSASISIAFGNTRTEINKNFAGIRVRNTATGHDLAALQIMGQPSGANAGVLNLSGSGGVIGVNCSGEDPEIAAQASMRGSVYAGILHAAHKMYVGLFPGVQVANSTNLLGAAVRHRHFGSANSGGMVKAALNPGEMATWWTGTEVFLVVKLDDGSGNVPAFSPAGFL